MLLRNKTLEIPLGKAQTLLGIKSSDKVISARLSSEKAYYNMNNLQELKRNGDKLLLEVATQE